MLIDPGPGAAPRLRCDLIDDDSGRPALDQCSDDLSRPQSITFYVHDDALGGLVAYSTVPHGAPGPSHSWRGYPEGGLLVREVSASPAGTVERRWLGGCSAKRYGTHLVPGGKCASEASAAAGLAHEPATQLPLRGEERSGAAPPAAVASAHDEHGRMTYAEVDEDRDGEPEITQHVEYLEAWRRVVHTVVDHGVLTQRFLDYDDELRLVSTLVEIEGEPAGRELRTYFSCSPGA